MSWSPDDLPSFAGRRVVVTGGNSGIGFHTSLALGRAGAAVTLACRSPERAEEAASRLRRAGADDVGVALLDLADLSSVADFAESWRGPLDVLVNNAGVMAPPTYRETVDGLELQLGTNHFGHFALTGRLLPRLLEAEAPRVTTVASLAHRRGTGTVLAGNPRRGYRPERYYANTKLANLLFAFELQRRAERHGSALVSNAVHPGVAATHLVASDQGLGSIPGVSLVGPAVLRLVLQSSRRGAEPTLYAVAEAGPGSYSGPQRFGESRGPAGPAHASALSRDETLAAELWRRSVEVTGVEFAWE